MLIDAHFLAIAINQSNQKQTSMAAVYHIPKILQFSPRQLQWMNGVIQHVMQHVCRQPLPLIVESAFQLDRIIRYQPFDDKYYWAHEGLVDELLKCRKYTAQYFSPAHGKKRLIACCLFFLLATFRCLTRQRQGRQLVDDDPFIEYYGLVFRTCLPNYPLHEDPCMAGWNTRCPSVEKMPPLPVLSPDEVPRVERNLQLYQHLYKMASNELAKKAAQFYNIHCAAKQTAPRR